MTIARLVSTAAIFALTAGSAFAEPCNTGTTKPKSPDQHASAPKSSDVDGSSKNLAGGQQPASPGTVGAMNNAGANASTAQKDDGC